MIKAILTLDLLTKPQKDALAASFNISVEVLTYIRAETEICNIVKDFFENETIIFQYIIGSYRADMCFPEHRLVVEIDEYDHIAYPAVAETKRGILFESLGYKVVRADPYSTTFSIGRLLKKLVKIIKNIDC